MEIKEVSQIFWVTNGNINNREIIIIQQLITIFGQGLMNHLTIIRSKFPSFEDQDACEEDKKELQKELVEITPNLGENQMVYLDNPPLEGRNAEANKEIREISRTICGII